MAARRFEMLDRMDPELQALAIAQGGVLTRAQALDGGVPLRQLGSPSRPAAGATGALVHELPLLGERPARPFLVERKPERPAHHGNSRTVAADETVLVHGVPVTTLARTAVDVARHRGFAAGVITADAVLRREVPREELDAVLGRCLRWPGLFAAQTSVAFADALSESALESLGRVRFHEQGLPAPELQVWLGGPDGRIGRVDQYWPEHRTVAEADGALKYAAGTGLFAEKLREDRLRDAGFEVIRYTWDEALRYPQLLAIRVREAFARAARRRVG
ncbi:MAG: hypothetical protein ACR2K2_10240 [Mycobacteriales bacterium]